jgi:hypothetical protein
VSGGRFFVEILEIVDSGSDRVEKKLGPYSSRRTAEKAEAGVCRNLDTERFYTRVQPPQAEEDEASS